MQKKVQRKSLVNHVFLVCKGVTTLTSESKIKHQSDQRDAFTPRVEYQSAHKKVRSASFLRTAAKTSSLLKPRHLQASLSTTGKEDLRHHSFDRIFFIFALSSSVNGTVISLIKY
jgi:hypothetical protein